MLSPVEGVDTYPAGKPNTNTVPRDLALLEEESILICVTIDATTNIIAYDPNAEPNPADPATCVLTGTTEPAGSVPFGPKAAVLGINGSSAVPTITLWDDPIETNPQIDPAGDPPTETWEFWNHTVDAHPIHVHEVKFKVINRQAFDPTTGALDITNGPRPPEATEAGWKDTVIAYPSDVTRIVATFDLPGLYVWHCHIVEHEDNEMMVPYCIGNSDPNLGPVAPGCALQRPVAVDDSYTTNEETALTVPGPGVLANDTDSNPVNTLTARLVTGPANGTLTLNPDGSFTYTPNPNFNGSDSFIYVANDGALDSLTAATVTITVTPVNDPPVAVNDSVTTAEDAPVSGNVLANDTDVDTGDTRTASLVSGPANGTLTLNSDGSFTYTPNPNFNGSDAFTYKANDGVADSNVATVSITVTPVNDAPVAGNDGYSMTQGTTLNGVAPGVLANDSDPDGNALTAVLAVGPVNGSLTLNPNGSFSYTPRATFSGTDSFTYRASDGSVQSSVATVTLTVSPAAVRLNLSLTNATGTLTGLGPNGTNLAYANEDILSWNGFNYAMVFDGTVAGLPASANISGFDIDTANNRILMAFGADTLVPGVGAVTGSDIVAYSLGTKTFSLVFDGSDVGLGGGSESLDALQLLPDGRLIVSTIGLASVPSGRLLPNVVVGPDLLAFTPTTLGSVTTGTWAIYFDGSDVGLSILGEDVDAASVAVNGAIYLSTLGNFSVTGISGQDEDVFVCNAPVTGPNTTCTSFSLFFNGTAYGLGADDVDGIDLP